MSMIFAFTPQERGAEKSAPFSCVFERSREMTKQWWKYAGIRAIKTVCQTAVATIGTSAVLSEVDWLAVASASVLAGILSLLTSLAGIPEVDNYDSHVVEIQTRVNHDGLTDLVEKGEIENVYNQDNKAE